MWMPRAMSVSVNVSRITQEGAAVFEGQGSDMTVRRPSGSKDLVFRSQVGVR